MGWVGTLRNDEYDFYKFRKREKCLRVWGPCDGQEGPTPYDLLEMLSGGRRPAPDAPGMTMEGRGGGDSASIEGGAAFSIENA